MNEWIELLLKALLACIIMYIVVWPCILLFGAYGSDNDVEEMRKFRKMLKRFIKSHNIWVILFAIYAVVPALSIYSLKEWSQDKLEKLGIWR